jgi:hypothetical protein
MRHSAGSDITQTMSGMSGRCLPGRSRTDTDTTLKGCPYVRVSGALAAARADAELVHDPGGVADKRVGKVPAIR